MTKKYQKPLIKTISNSLACLIILFGFTPIQAQRSEYKIKQSIYYDAITLYYAINNYKAYPIPMLPFEVIENEGNVSAVSNADVPDFNTPNAGQGKKGNKYKIIESATGKILLDNCDDKGLENFYKNSSRSQFTSIDEKNAFIYSVLARNANIDTTSQEYIKSLYKENIYLNEDTLGNYLFVPKDFIHAFQNLSFNKAGGAIPKQILEGTVDFLIEAVNKEINEAFFIQMQKALSKVLELRVLFPKTLESLNKIEVTRYASSLNTMKAAFQEDIRGILSNISKLTEHVKYQKLINTYPALTLVFTTCDLISLFRTDAIPADIIYQVNNAPYITKCNANNFSSVIKLAALLSNSLRDIKINDENKERIGWLDRSRINLLRDNKPIFNIFMGLFAQQAKGISFQFGTNDSFNLQRILFRPEIKVKVLEGQFIVYNFSESVKKIDVYFQTIQGLKKSSSSTSKFISQYLELATEIINLAENCLNILPSEITATVRKEITLIKSEYAPVLKHGNSILGNIEIKEYGKALYEADTFLSKIFVLFGNDSSSKFEDIRKTYLKYGIFIASVAEAKSSKDVKEAIKAIALPTGSSRIKKERHFSISLNAYVGVYHSWNKQYDSIKLPKTETGITVPIGFAVNWGHFLSGSLSAYGGIVDVGAIFTYKVNTDSTVKSDIQFGQLLSPSIGFIYGLPVIKKYNIPLSIGANYQWGPKLKSVDEKGNSILPLLARRFNVFIAVDIPILNFHVSKK
jgi:hypothetical protein